VLTIQPSELEKSLWYAPGGRGVGEGVGGGVGVGGGAGDGDGGNSEHDPDMRPAWPLCTERLLSLSQQLELPVA